MQSIKIEKLNNSFEAEIIVASDKSISHRCAMFSLLSDKKSIIRNFLRAEDTLNSLNIVKSLGATIIDKGDIIEIIPPKEIKEPSIVLDCGNAGTGMRLFCGFLSGIEGSFVLSGDKYLNNRPMKRVTEPLRRIGAKIDGREDGNKAPLHIRGAKLKPFKYHSNISSAQVKSALILAGLRSSGVCYYKEDELSRDHTERMLKGMGADIEKEDDYIKISPLKKPLEPLDIFIPADPSSGFFFAVAASIIPDSKVIIKDVSLNPTRIEAYRILKNMGVDVEFIEKENIYEPIGDIVVKYKELNAIEIKDNISWLIDELPALAIAMSFAKGKSVVKNAKELRVKESDRIKSVVENLKLCGIDTKEFEDGYEIIGGNFKKAVINSFGDHRIAMSFLIAGLKEGIEVVDTECINTSFPNFLELIDTLK